MNPNNNNNTDIPQPPGAYDQRRPDQNPVQNPVDPQGQQQPASRNTNNDIAQPGGAYNNQRHPVYPQGQQPAQSGTAQPSGPYGQNRVYPPGGQQPASGGQHDTNVQSGTAQPRGPYDNDQNPVFPPGGQQPAPIGQHDRNYRGTVGQDGTQGQYGAAPHIGPHDPNNGYGRTVGQEINQGQYGIGQHDPNNGYGRTGQDNTQINQGQYGVAPPIGQHDPNNGYGRTVGPDGTPINQGKYGAAPPTSLTGAPGAGGQRVDDPLAPGNNINSNNSGSTTSHPSLTRSIGKFQAEIGSLLDIDSLQRGGQKKVEKANTSDLAQAGRLENEALERRQRAVAHGADPAHLVLGGPQGT